jgi:hypothetical protein
MYPEETIVIDIYEAPNYEDRLKLLRLIVSGSKEDCVDALLAKAERAKTRQEFKELRLLLAMCVALRGWNDLRPPKCRCKRDAKGRFAR